MKQFWSDYCQTFKDIMRQQSILTTLILSVVFYSFFYPTAYKAQQAESLPIIIVDEEQSPLTQTIIQQVSQSPYVEVTLVSGNFLEARQMVEEQKADGILLLPESLTMSLRHGETGGIGLYLSTAYFLKTKQIGVGIASSIESTLVSYTEKFGQISEFKPAIPIHQIPLFNTLSGYGSYIFPAVAPLIVHQTIFLGLCMLIATYREQKQRITPSRFWAIFAAILTIGCCSSFYLFGFSFWIYDYPRGGNFIGMLITVPIFVGCVIGLALWLSSYLDIPERAGHVIVVTSIPLFLLTGTAWPHHAMPFILETFAWCLPSTHGVQLFVQLNQMGVPLGDVKIKLTFLLITGIIFTSLGYYRLVKVHTPT